MRSEIGCHQVLMGNPRFLTSESIAIDCLYAVHPSQPYREQKHLKSLIFGSKSLIYVARNS
ncbi:hypothetical protein NG798_05840 [Ancylothrix sp. C2]|uniref:hypothetical protein n=1 Tax=Ancylothrix sp. D3o TaxID=2953691 RepID=UPI0021BB5AB0|nr:hypothetical protein [Ancylothrix sp. D3o]MCT7949302.1 hypothetical protein [Ancylothrix sp. D3o]